MDRNLKCPFPELVPGIIGNIMSFMTPIEILKMSFVCHEWKDIAQGDLVWQHHLRFDFNLFYEHDKVTQRKTLKQEYIKLFREEKEARDDAIREEIRRNQQRPMIMICGAPPSKNSSDGCCNEILTKMVANAVQNCTSNSLPSTDEERIVLVREIVKEVDDTCTLRCGLMPDDAEMEIEHALRRRAIISTNPSTSTTTTTTA